MTLSNSQCVNLVPIALQNNSFNQYSNVRDVKIARKKKVESF